MQIDYESQKLTEQLQSTIQNERIKNEVIKFAETKEKITIVDDGTTKKILKSTF